MLQKQYVCECCPHHCHKCHFFSCSSLIETFTLSLYHVPALIWNSSSKALLELGFEKLKSFIQLKLLYLILTINILRNTCASPIIQEFFHNWSMHVLHLHTDFSKISLEQSCPTLIPLDLPPWLFPSFPALLTDYLDKVCSVNPTEETSESAKLCVFPPRQPG